MLNSAVIRSPVLWNLAQAFFELLNGHTTLLLSLPKRDQVQRYFQHASTPGTTPGQKHPTMLHHAKIHIYTMIRVPSIWYMVNVTTPFELKIVQGTYSTASECVLFFLRHLM